jgi:hypothetical protein
VPGMRRPRQPRVVVEVSSVLGRWMVGRRYPARDRHLLAPQLHHQFVTIRHGLVLPGGRRKRAGLALITCRVSNRR